MIDIQTFFYISKIYKSPNDIVTKKNKDKKKIIRCLYFS